MFLLLESLICVLEFFNRKWNSFSYGLAVALTKRDLLLFSYYYHAYIHHQSPKLVLKTAWVRDFGLGFTASYEWLVGWWWRQERQRRSGGGRDTIGTGGGNLSVGGGGG
jgi:hypothetical protein